MDPITPGLAKESSALLAQERDVLGRRRGDGRDRCRSGRSFEPPFPNHYLMHGSGKFWDWAGLLHLEISFHRPVQSLLLRR